MRKRQLMMPLAGLAVTAGALLSAGISAGPASAAVSNGCPATKAGVPVASNVTASHSDSGNTTTYTFTSLVNQQPSGGIPGLINYCVYPTSPIADPTSHTVAAKGDNNTKWVYGAGGSNNFAFTRPFGNPSNIGLDGNSTPMGTATWNVLPDKQAIVLHINDPSMCASLYGAGTSPTCFVRPSPPPPPGPDCTHGDINAAYNSMPFNVTDCINPAISFQGTSTSEFGNEVNLATGTAGLKHTTLKVDFQDFACQSGHWDGSPSPCDTPAGATWQHPITANLYDPSNLTTPIATTTVTQTIPFRPSADPLNCPANPTKWFNPNAIGGGACQNSIGTVLTFDLGTVNLPSDVVWTVSFNTSDHGPTPIGPAACSSDPAGCPYDSLNVGDNGNTNGVDFPGSHIDGAPYVGTDTHPGGAFLSSTWAGAYGDGGAGGTGSLRLDPVGWDGLRPLGEIITTP